MTKMLRFLVLMQAATVAILLFFGFRIATSRNVEPDDLAAFRKKVAAVSERAEWHEIGSTLINIVENRGAAFDSLRARVLIFVAGLGLSALCNVILAVAVLRKFRFAGYEDPSVVVRRF